MNKVNKDFINSSHFITELKLCSIRLIDNCKFPWIILIPNRKKVTDITELNLKDQILFMKEIVFCSNKMKKLFKTSKLNVEKIGNIVPQLHLHIIARTKNDSSWPLSVWVVKSKSYKKNERLKILKRLKKVF
ncbi:diadenosine tetraphosphate (Ap4A) HIT family hydrolase [Candidatus Pelagibacter ubique]|uniref:Diadenosine tetraphosphate (Ap4A) HIT family hydrolase n=1 Tax=Pelagibacter ubique TaxID=198252 RepID=A0ABX1T136_PELUQ|nr:HIT family protein [Candidatus Pelagibacter ubique]NMN67825.1 diadenosine tetraphosphate (Ap4A) HIT family hydrolase [Candidatus Pelagibacter ubique]